MIYLKAKELKEHKYLIELLDSNKLNIKQYDLSLLNFSEEDSDSEDINLIDYE